MATFTEVWESHTGRFTTKTRASLSVYEHHLRRFVGKPIRLVEFGVNKGGSLELWRKYLGPQAEIVGVDLDARSASCVDAADPRMHVLIGNQTDRELLGYIPPMHVVIDDCSHHPKDQRITFRVLWPRLVLGGMYAIEDLDERHPELIHEVLDVVAGPFSKDRNASPGCPVYVYADMLVCEKFPIKRWDVIHKGGEKG